MKRAKRYKSVKCPYCRRKMHAIKNEFPTTTDDKSHWKCVFCKVLFHIVELPWYPLATDEEMKEK
jgi:uncharacterized Zn-finger protein